MLLLFVTVVTVVQRPAKNPGTQVFCLLAVYLLGRYLEVFCLLGTQVSSGITRTGQRSSWVTARPSLLLFSRPNVSYCCWGAQLLFCYVTVNTSNTVHSARTQVHQPRPFQRPDRSLKADWLVVDERSTSNGAVRQRVDPARPGAGYGFARRQTALSTTLTQGFTTLS